MMIHAQSPKAVERRMTFVQLKQLILVAEAALSTSPYQTALRSAIETLRAVHDDCSVFATLRSDKQ